MGYITDIKGFSSKDYSIVERSEILLTETGIIFLKSEIEQNLGFLMDSRNSALNSIYFEISEKTRKLKTNIILLTVIFILIILGIFLTTFRHLNINISILNKNLSELGKGKIPEEMKEDNTNEFSLVKSNLNKLSKYMAKLTQVAKNIGRNDFSSDFKPLGKDDGLGNAVLVCKRT